METIWDLAAFVARRLSGRQVVIRCQQPAYSGDVATTHRNRAGKVIIDLSPALLSGDAEKFLHVLCHEAAHAKLHAPTFARSDIDRQPPASLSEGKLSAARKAARARREDEAEAQAAEWMKYARRQAARLQRSDPRLSDIEARLWALANWKG